MILPFSRKHESEADYIGLALMSLAGYTPDTAVTFWQKMSSNSGGSKVSELLSTHPSDATRISDIKKNLPAIKQKFYTAPVTTTTSAATKSSAKTTKTTKKSTKKK